MKVLIIGGTGLLGLQWGLLWRESAEIHLVNHRRRINVRGVMSASISLTHEALSTYIRENGIEVVINAAGYSNVEFCERNPRLAYALHATKSSLVARVCRQLNVTFVAISSDHVVDLVAGSADEGSPVTLRNTYAASKFCGEQLTLTENEHALVVRTNFFGWGSPYRSSFSDWILDGLRNSTQRTLFSDVIFSPIYIPTLVDVIGTLLLRGIYGLIHIAGDKSLSKFEFGTALAKVFQVSDDCLKPGRLADRQDLVSRPHNMSLNNLRLRNEVGLSVPSLHEQLLSLRSDEKKMKMLYQDVL